MPRRKQSKERRRLNAAQSAIRAAERNLPNGTSAGKTRKRTRKQNHTLSSLHVPRYIRSVYNDVLDPSVDLPTSGYVGPYSSSLVTARVQLNLANNSALHASLVMNPYAFWTDKIFIEKMQTVSGTTSQVYAEIPTCFQHSLTSNSEVLPENRVVSTSLQAVTASSQYANSLSAAYNGKVRCTGVNFRIVYTGTELNKGGTIYCYHNPANSSLMSQDEGAAAANWPRTPFENLGEVNAANQMVKAFRMEDSFEWTWRPSGPEFQDVRTVFPYESPNIAGGNSGNPDAFSVLPPEAGAGKPTPLGWITGFDIRPAAGSSAAPSNYVVEIAAHYDLYITRGGQDSNGAPIVPATKFAHADPAAAAAVSNALGQIHHHRMVGSFTSAAKSMGLNLLQGAKKVGKDLAIDAITRGISSLM